MIARIWRGRVPASKAEDYFEHLKGTGLKDYEATQGNRGVYVLRRTEGDHSVFVLLILWESWDSIRGFAGPDIDKAVYYPEDPDFLVEPEPTVAHFEVLSGPGGTHKG